MPELAKFSPLAGYREGFAALPGEGVVIREGSFLAQINLRGNADAPGFESSIERVVGCALPRAANTVSRSTGRDRSILWLAPDEWLIVGSEGEERALCTDLKAGLGDDHVSIVDVSANRTIIELSGASARDVLVQGCSLDLDPSVFATDQCAQTLLARAQVVIEQFDDAPTFRLYVRPSFSRYLADWLMIAIR